jgi:hypothetical protein
LERTLAKDGSGAPRRHEVRLAFRFARYCSSSIGPFRANVFTSALVFGAARIEDTAAPTKYYRLID